MVHLEEQISKTEMIKLCTMARVAKIHSHIRTVMLAKAFLKGHQTQLGMANI